MTEGDSMQTPIGTANRSTAGQRANPASAAQPVRSNAPMPQPQFLTIRWEGTAEDGTEVTLQATLCRTHRQVIALRSTSARGVRRQLGESCDKCHGREPTAV